MKKTACLLIVLGIMIAFSIGCEKKPPPVVPEEVDAEIAAAKAAYDEFMKLNPPSTLTFHYRKYMKAAEDARAERDYEKAIEAAGKAKEQAVLARNTRLQSLKAAKEETLKIKSELESTYLPTLLLVYAYWDTIDAINAYNYEKAKAMTDDLNFKIEQEKKRSYTESKTFRVTASKEYIQRWGDVRMYKEITADGKLREIVATVRPGRDVLFVRTEMFSRVKTFYFVEIPGTGVQGWMAEQYVAPDRMQRR